MIVNPKPAAKGGLKNGVFPRVNGGPVGPNLVHKLRTMCNSIVTHIYDVAPQKFRVDNMQCYFKMDEAGEYLNQHTLTCSLCSH
jgi:hypothetical protein